LVLATQFVLVAGMVVHAAPAAAAGGGGSITGVVSIASTTTPLTGICAYLYATSGARTSDAAACTNAQGVYAMAVAKAGPYNVQFTDTSATYATQWYNNQPTQATANTVSVKTGRTTRNINAAMISASAPTVSGISPTSGPTVGGRR
jgi:hypothetical protein